MKCLPCRNRAALEGVLIEIWREGRHQCLMKRVFNARMSFPSEADILFDATLYHDGAKPYVIRIVGVGLPKASRNSPW